jgi:signal transduction histidine kinase
LESSVENGHVQLIGGITAQPYSSASGAVLLVPLVRDEPVGVLALEWPTASIDPPLAERAGELGSEAADRIQRARPDVGHHCLFRRMVEVDPGGMAVVEGPHHVFSYATPGFRQMLHSQDFALLGRPIRQVLPGMSVEHSAAILDEVRRTGRAFRTSSVMTEDQYGTRYFDLHLVPQLSHDGVPTAIFIMAWPRTDEVLTRQALEATILRLAEAQSVFSAVLDGTINGIIFIGRDLQVLYANRRMRDLFDVDPASLVGKDIRTATSERLAARMRVPEEFHEHVDALCNDFEATTIDEVEVASPVRRILERYSGPVYKEDGTLHGHIEVYADVTAVRDLQRNKDDFLSLVSHELKTPVTSIKGYAQLLQRRAQKEQLSEQTVAAYSVIERQAARMQELIDALLDLSRLETGRLALEIGELNLNELVERVAEMVQMTAEAHTIGLERPAKPLWIRGDSRRLEQVVMNLLTNAVRYSEDGSTVRVILGESDANAVISVADEGPGIPADAQPHIFERFYRASESAQAGGMGIGLYITKGIVEQHGGTITLQSQLGVGSTFTVVLPTTHDE